MAGLSGATVRAAGGVVWRAVGGAAGGSGAADGGTEIALVHRPRYDDWSLPKGKLDPGEHPLVAAVREVYEETAVRAVPQTRLPTIGYLTGEPGVEKRVDFWAMRADTWATREADDEVEEVRWLPVDAVAGALSYAHDRGVVKAFRELPALTGLVVFVRHARAGKRNQWPGPDDERPLDPAGTEDARAMSALLGLFGVSRAVAATPLRCRQTLAPLGLDISTDPVFDGAAAPDAAVTAVRELVATGKVGAICSQGELMSPVLAALTGRDSARFETSKGHGWVLSFAGDRVVGCDRLDPRA